MRTKDRIVKTTEMNCHNTLEERLAEQDRISFEEGTNEVAEWVERLYHYNTFEQFPVGGGTATEISESRVMVIKEDDWQAKLKSWYIRGRDEQ